MAVTSEEFEALVPVPYSQARPQFQTGDIVLFHSKAAPSKLIEFFTDSLWCHAAIIWVVPSIDRVMLLESVDTFGVRATRLSHRVNGFPPAPDKYPGQLVVLRHNQVTSPISDAQETLMMGTALDHLGYPYGRAELTEIAQRIALGFVGKIIAGQVSSSTSFICSQYVANCYAAAGITLTPDREGFTAPADIARDPNVRPVCSLCPDPE